MRLLLMEDKARRAAVRAAAKLGFRKFKGLLEGPSRDMTDFVFTPGFRRIFDSEKEAVRKWMKTGKGKSYLDVGAGDGRMTKVALETGASHVTAIDIVDSCIDELRKIPGVEVRKMNARKLDLEEGSIDRVMVLGNTMAGMHEEWPGGEKSFQAEVLRQLYRAAREEICITFHSPETLRTMLEVYRLNKWKFYDYDDENGIRRIEYTTRDFKIIEFRSQHFRRVDIERLMAEAEISSYSITPIDSMQWMVLISKQ